MGPAALFPGCPQRNHDQESGEAEQDVGDTGIKVFGDQEQQVFFARQSAELVVHASRACRQSDNTADVLQAKECGDAPATVSPAYDFPVHLIRWGRGWIDPEDDRANDFVDHHAIL